MFLCVFGTFGAKNVVNINALGGSEVQNYGITIFFSFGSKKHGIYSGFWPAHSKNTDMYGCFTI